MEPDNIQKLIEYWFSNSDIWFGCGPETDKYISEEFGQLLHNPYSCCDKDPRYNLGVVILWDQIARHVHRGDPIEIGKYHKRALDMSLYMLGKKQDKTLRSEERCFLLMPLRHTFKLEYLEQVIEKVKRYIEDDGFLPYKRFYRATLLSYSKLVTKLITPSIINDGVSLVDIKNILDYRAVKSIKPRFNKLDIYKTPIYKEFNTLIKRKNPEGITISISGGVDSMVCSYVLYHIRKKYPTLKLIAVMVNYNNRPESYLETQLVTRWLQQLEIPLYVRDIKYLKRKSDQDSSDRNFYETVTKQFRFDLYKRFGYPVVLGHNRDDSIENIVTNILKGRNYDNLRGMEQTSTIEDIIFYRPMIDISKSDIYDFANKHCIPFLTDSTPSWSDRGRIRDMLVPSLNSFSDYLIPSLVRLSDNTTELFNDITILLDRLIKTLRVTDNGIVMTIINSERQLGFESWKYIIKYVTSKLLNINMCSNNSVRILLKHLETPRSGKTILSKNLEVIHTPTSLTFCIR